MADKSVAATAGGLAGFFSRPKVAYEDKNGENVTVTPRSVDLVYIRSCSQCKFGVHGKSAKCIIESCKDVKVEFEEPIMSGTLELISSKDVTISINPQDALPTVSIENCEGIHLHYYEPRAIGGIYTVKCRDIVVHLQPPHQPESVLDLPEDDVGQYVSMLKGGKMVTVQAIREGAGYLTTAEKKEMDEKREEELLRRMGEEILKTLKITKPGEKKGSGLPSKPADTLNKPSTHDTDTRSKPVPASHSQSSTQKPSEGVRGGGSEEVRSPEEEGGDDGPLAAAFRAKRRDLKPTETVERHLPVVGTGGGGSGRFNPAIKDEEEKREFFDSDEQLEKKVERAAEWVQQSKHVIMFTGAGVSTSCGIPDYRSGMNTVLPTGPGVWELRAHGVTAPQGTKTVPFLKALPSPTHMAIVSLHKAGLVKLTVSQNVDGLHRRSGLDPSQLAELHGNTNLETCQKCHRQYLRDFETREAMHVFDHRTSRQCDDPACRGVLEDSIINFGETLPEKELTNGFSHARKADLCIVLGSSLRVRPACQIPEVVEEAGGKVIICNLQRIPQFPQGGRTMQVFCKCDEFMAALMEKLGLEIPPFLLKRRVRISAEKTEGTCKLSVTGLDVDEDVPYSFIKSVTVCHQHEEWTVSSEPLSLPLPPDANYLTLTFHFHGHYGEPSLQLPFTITEGSKVINMSYDITQGTWTLK